MKKAERVINFLKECLQNRPEVADWKLIFDTQSRVLIDFLKIQSSQLVILDYGCGKLRVLHALVEFLKEINWKYTGFDPFFDDSQLDDLAKLQLPKQYCYEILQREALLKRSGTYNIVILQNVLHEVGIFETAQVLQDCRVLLDDSGVLLLLETPLLPKCEPNFVPIYDWEIPMIFSGHKQLSTKTPKGLPILFHMIAKAEIPNYREIFANVTNLL